MWRLNARVTMRRCGVTVIDLDASVILPVRDGARFLRRLIPALRAQTLPNERFEIIIADDGSRDGLIDGIALEDDWLRVSRGEPANAYAARNRAAKLARGRVLAFIDADCIPAPNWLEAGIKALETADMVAGRIRFIVPARRTVWTLLDIETTKNQERHVTLGNAETANLFVRRDTFEKLEGFDPSLPSHGDFDFANRCVRDGGKLLYCPEALVQHPTRDTCRPFLRAFWDANHSYGSRVARNGGIPYGRKFRSWVPLVQTIRSRRRFGMSLGLDRSWMNANGIQPSLTEQVKTLPLIYLGLPYMAATAQTLGSFSGRQRTGTS